MPSSIPYDPSLTLANVVSPEVLVNIKQILGWQEPVDALQESLNSLTASKRSLDMTKNELTNLEVDTKEVDKALEALKIEISKTAVEYATKKIEAEVKIRPFRAAIRKVSDEVESPVDYVKTEIKSLPLAADSLNMDVQYFSHDSNDQTGTSLAKKVSGFIAISTRRLGYKVAAELSSSAARQVSNQAKRHSLSGTLVLSVTCTHKNAQVLAPLILNVDKGIKSFNRLFPNLALDPTQQSQMMQLAAKDDNDPKNTMRIISGMTFGSSFVGMVHILKTTDTTVDQSLSSMAASLQAQMDVAGWIQDRSGGFGVNTAMSNEVKNLLSTQNAQSHVTILSMGVIPSIVANDLKLGVETFAKFDPESSLKAIAAIQNATAKDQGSVQASAAAARTGQQLVALKTGNIQAALSSLAEIRDGSNKVLDINSMMAALDDYLKKAAKSTSGVPLKCYVKDITKNMLAQMWVAKYYPDQRLKLSFDDSGNTAPGRSSNNGGSNGSSNDGTEDTPSDDDTQPAEDEGDANEDEGNEPET